MNAYLIIKFLHIAASFGLVGPLMLVPRWLRASREALGQRMLHDLHFLTGLSGWGVLISGAVIVYLQPGFLDALWMRVSLGLFVFTQIFDHFWADKREEEFGSGSDAAARSLIGWLFTKIAIYLAISLLMVLKHP